MRRWLRRAEAGRAVAVIENGRFGILTLLLLGWGWPLLAQQPLQPALLVEEKKERGLSFERASLFELVPATRDVEDQLGEDIRSYDMLQVKEDALRRLIRQEPEGLRLALPSGRFSGLELELVRVNLYADGFAVYESSKTGPAEVEPGLHYRGVVPGEEGALVALSVFEGELMGLVSSPRLGNQVLGKLEGAQWAGAHILYDDRDRKLEEELYCATPDSGEGYGLEELADPVALRGPGDCVSIYFEVDHDVFQNKGGTDASANYIAGIFNEVATLYAAENVNVTISEMLVWDTPSPYNGSSSSRLLSQFQSYRTSFNGDLAQLVSYQASGGIAVVNGLCRSNPALRMSFASIGSTFRVLPNYSFTVMVVAHELGHLLGSQHTHACVWNGNNSAIDGCAGYTEGGCANPGVPAGGGTIMSYCHLSNAGINFSLGFGPQPGNVIRNAVAGAACLQACSDPGGGGGGGSNCSDISLELKIVLDNYGSETTWQLKSASGTVVAAGGPYANGAAGQVVSESICVEDGCYAFVINDSYGDGICCGYGSGSYELKGPDGTVLAEGASFGAVESTDLCTTGAPPSGGDGCEGFTYTLDLTLDEYGRETTWALLGGNGQELYSGGPYFNRSNGVKVEETFCLEDGCYTFEIRDTYGDGICCSYGNGSFVLKDEQGATVASGGRFGSGQRIDFCTGEGGGNGSNCIAIDFAAVNIESYGGSQDRGTYELLTNGAVLKLQDNAWKYIPLDYTITPGTVIEFDFRSTREGEVHGIGFDDNNSISSSLTFKVFGTQNWGNLNYAGAYAGNGEWQSITIPVGSFYTGEADRLFFVADHDSSPGNGNSFFRNVRIHEGGGCEGQLAGSGVLQIEALAPQALHVFPNPANDQLTLRFDGKAGEEAELLIYNVMGQMLQRRRLFMNEGPNVEILPVQELPAGTYFLRLQSGALQRESKFTIQR